MTQEKLIENLITEKELIEKDLKELDTKIYDSRMATRELERQRFEVNVTLNEIYTEMAQELRKLK